MDRWPSCNASTQRDFARAKLRNVYSNYDYAVINTLINKTQSAVLVVRELLLVLLPIPLLQQSSVPRVL